MRGPALAFCILCLAASPALAQPEIHIPQGKLSGAAEGSVATFKNIPFAAPPVGPLRWRAPRPAAGWSDVRDATNFGPACPQGPRPSDVPKSVKVPESEDCLTLNVWTPNATPDAKLPVMVWIYGGSFVTGSGAFPIYDGVELAQHGVVVVTLNYRLGWLGFFDHPALAAEAPGEPSGNFGLLDQIAALQWVKANIAAFGGDPSNVTIFGESAGGISVNDLMVSPLANGLFQKAISESGLGLVPATTAEDAQKEAVDFAERQGASGSPADTLATLRALSVADILKDRVKNAKAKTSPFVDGIVLPAQPPVLFSQGKIAHAAYLAGSNSDEATLMDAYHESDDAMLKPLGDNIDNVRKFYEADGKLTDHEFARQVYDDAIFASGAQGLADFVAKTGEPAYVYQFAYVADAIRAKQSGVGHGGEVPYVFGMTGLSQDPVIGWVTKYVTDKDRTVVAKVQDYWTNFAKTGNPNGSGLPQWDATATSDPKTLVIDQEIKTVPGFRKNQIAIMYNGWAQHGVPVPN